jgi:extracellular factor (EF) 3-hydroxypalmitic acid methyl ester biosynthesis protein
MRDLNVNGPLNNVKISLGEKILYNGTCTISQAYEDAQKKNRVIIEPRHKLINIDLIDMHEIETSIATEVAKIVESNKTFKGIDPDFKTGVADLRILLEEFKTYLETPKLKTDLEKNSELLEHIYKIFYPAVDGKIKHIDRLVTKLDLAPEKTAPYKEYYQKHLRSLFLPAPFIHRIFFKPSGYPGDYEMINMVHRNALEGKNPLDKLLNKYASSIPIAQTVRKRTEFFTNEIKNLTQKNSTAKVLSIASGPALEFEMLLKKYPKLVDDVSITLLDQDINALRFSQENLYKTRIETQSKVNIDFIHKNIGNYLKELNRNKTRENFDIVYASGLFDYFDFKTSKFVIKYLLKQTRPGGKIIIANLSKDGHDHKTILEFVGEWYLTYRSKEDMVKLSETIPKGINFEIKEIENGLCKIIEIKV